MPKGKWRPRPRVVYRILEPEGRRLVPIGAALAVADDLGELRDHADHLSHHPKGEPGVYPIAVGPGESRPWGELQIEGPGRWEIRSHDGTTTIVPGAFIL